MLQTEILRPVVVLAAWTLVMLAWLVVARLPAMKRAGIDLTKVRGGNGASLDAALPPSAQWPAHNYAHLVEQPTIFYAVVIVLALIGQGHGFNLFLAWGYVAVRIVHSIVQATANVVLFRFLLFALSTLMLIGLTLHAAIALF